MEKPVLNQKESGINRIIGFGSEKEEELLNYFREMFEGQSSDSKEKEKTAEQLELISRINKEMKKFLIQYGAEAIEIPAENIHVIDKTKYSEEKLIAIYKKMGTEDGFYLGSLRGIGILRDYEKNKLAFMQTVVHEMLHLQGFYSYQKSEKEFADSTMKIGDEHSSMNMRRSGFSIGTKDKKEWLFNKLNESIITELQIRFEMAHMTDWPELEREMRRRDAHAKYVSERDNKSIDSVRRSIAHIQEESTSVYKSFTYPYFNERKEFNFMVDEIFNKNPSDFESREDVFNVFARATITGRLLPVARLIEKTFGKGSFRIVGENSAKEPIQKP